MYGNLTEYLTEHHIIKMNHDHGILLNAKRMKLVNILVHLEILDLFLSKLALILPIFKSFKSDCTLKFAYSLKSSSLFNI